MFKTQKTSLSSTTILLCTVTMFLICNSPRLQSSFAYFLHRLFQVNPICLRSIHDQVNPSLSHQKIGEHSFASSLNIFSVLQGITPFWYLYAMASVQLLQVINTSLNFPIYWFIGNFRQTFINLLPCKAFRSDHSKLKEFETELDFVSQQINKT